MHTGAAAQRNYYNGHYGIMFPVHDLIEHNFSLCLLISFYLLKQLESL